MQPCEVHENISPPSKPPLIFKPNTSRSAAVHHISAKSTEHFSFINYHVGAAVCNTLAFINDQQLKQQRTDKTPLKVDIKSDASGAENKGVLL